MQDESGIVTAEVAFKKKKILFDGKFDLNLRGKKTGKLQHFVHNLVRC